MSTTTLGPDDGTVTVRTSREGRAAKMGHDLVIDVTSWKATIADDGAVTFDADPRSLVVRDGVGGIKPLTAEDREHARRSIDQKVLHALPIAFRSTAVHRTGDRLAVAGDLTLAGETHPVRAELHVDADGVARATISILQTSWGITPHSAMMGALRVRDRVDVELEVALPQHARV